VSRKTFKKLPSDFDKILWISGIWDKKMLITVANDPSHVFGNYHTAYQASPHFNDHFPGGYGLAGTRMSPFWISLELRMKEVVVTNGTMRRASSHIVTNKPTPSCPAFYQLDAVPVTKPTVSKQRLTALSRNMEICEKLMQQYIGRSFRLF